MIYSPRLTSFKKDSFKLIETSNAVSIQILILFAVLFSSCSQVKMIEQPKKKIDLRKDAKNEINNEEKNPKLPLIEKISVINLFPGKVSLVQFKINLEDGLKNLRCGNENISFMVEGKQARVFMTESYFSSRKEVKCFFQDKQILLVKIKKFPYKSEKLNVDKKRVTLSKKDLARVIKEREILKKVYKKTASYYLFNQSFKKPLNSFVTSHYGNRRIFNNKKKSQHLGNDLRAAVGVPIPVSNKGKVIFTGNLFYSGNIVIVDHGLNLFSTYGHLSKIKVSEGSIINQGDIVGHAGATGRVSGPHLHWGIKLNGHWVDGFSLVKESKKMFTK